MEVNAMIYLIFELQIRIEGLRKCHNYDRSLLPTILVSSPYTRKYVGKRTTTKKFWIKNQCCGYTRRSILIKQTRELGSSDINR